MNVFARLLALFICASGVALASDAVVPLEDFLREVTFDEIKVSPDGSKVAALSTWKEHLNLYVIDVKTKRPTMLTGLTTLSVAGVAWVGNNRLIFTAVKDGGLTGGLFAIDADGKHSLALGKSVEQQASDGRYVARLTEFLGFYGQSTDEILVTSNERRLFDPDVYRMNVHTGSKRIVATNPGHVRRWIADNTGAVRVGHGEVGREQFIVYRDADKGEFKEIKRWDFTEGTFEPLAFDATNTRLYVLSSLGRDTAAIELFDLGGKTATILFQNDTYDAANVICDRRSSALLGYRIMTEKPMVVWTDERMKSLQAEIDAALPGTQNSIYSRSADTAWVVIAAHSDRDPGTFYLLNTREMTMEKLVSRAEWIKPSELGEMKPIQYPSRDGHMVHGYLTLPTHSSGKRLPMVVNPHGGPWARDEWGYNPEVQLLASRGYAVLQINFRGSTGYGRRWLEAGYGQWGLAMQDDITDGVRWAIEQGVADPHRIAIYGASYGGYATMAGLAFTPELYRCGVNYVGVTDISLLLGTIPEAWENTRSQLEAMTGNAKGNKERLEATSPLRNVDKIQAPVFFAYGRLDERVDIKHGTKLAAALRKKGVPVVWMERQDEGHGYRHKENRLAFYRQLVSFLEENLKP